MSVGCVPIPGFSRISKSNSLVQGALYTLPQRDSTYNACHAALTPCSIYHVCQYNIQRQSPLFHPDILLSCDWPVFIELFPHPVRLPKRESLFRNDTERFPLASRRP